MKHHLLPSTGTDYKANLHCHTTCSDGRKTAAQVKEIYRQMGYSIVAYTDHDVYIGHNDLTDDTFLALNGFEIGGTENDAQGDFMPLKCYHICYIAKDPENLTHPCWHRTKYVSYGTAPWRDQVIFDEETADYEREYTHKGFNDLVRFGKERGFFVTYNHPTWSLESYPEYSGYEGMDAMEMFNGGSSQGGHLEYNPRVYDDLLRQGKRIYAIGGDDNHASEPGSPYSDCGVAWTVIRAERLDYPSVIGALEQGQFYASAGPAIYDLYIEDGRVHITCSEAAQITLNTGTRHSHRAAAPSGETITSASFPYRPDFGYLRLTVTDREGKHATTNAYFCDQIEI